ncbi:MAG: extracellular solute-binding protein [Desulfobacterales bacterium]|nr:extracellular solute-binding protein [Desulfobacterales bacterium]
MKRNILSVLVVCGILFSSQISYTKPIVIRIHCWKDYSKPYLNKFKKIIKRKYNKDIKVVITLASNPKAFWDVSRGKIADIITPAHNLFKSKNSIFITKKIVLPVNLNNIPNYKFILSNLQKNRFVTIKDQVYGVPYTMGSYGLAYNSKKVKEPSSWNVLWEDKNKNKYTISKDYSDCNIYITALSLGIEYKSIYSFNKILKKITLFKFQEKLNKLSRNSFSKWTGTANYKEFHNLSYAATWGYAVAKANKNGGKWKMANPHEGTTMWVDHWSITQAVKGDKLKKRLCEEWINYCLSPEPQIGSIRNWGVSPVVSNINRLLTKEEIITFKVGNVKYWKSISLWENQNRDTTEAYKSLWKRAMYLSK